MKKKYVITSVESMKFTYDDGSTHQSGGGMPEFLASSEKKAAKMMDYIKKRIEDHTWWCLPEDGVDKHEIVEDVSYKVDNSCGRDMLRRIVVKRVEDCNSYGRHSLLECFTTYVLWRMDENNHQAMFE